MTAAQPAPTVSAQWAEAAQLLSRVPAGRVGGLTPQLADDASALRRARTRPDPSAAAPVRIAVLRRLADPGVVGLLTGRPVDWAGPPSLLAGAIGEGRRDVLPLAVAAADAPARLEIGPEQTAVLERLARRFAADPGLPPATSGWLRARHRGGEPPFEAEPGDLSTAVLWRHIQDVAARVPPEESSALEPLFARPVVWRGGPSDRYASLPSTGPGAPVELLDVPGGSANAMDSATAAVRRLVGSCHGVLLVFPATGLSDGAGPAASGTVEWLTQWTRALRALPLGPSPLHIATADRRAGNATMPDTAEWLSGRLASVSGGPRPRVHAVAIAEAQEVVAVLTTTAGLGAAPGAVPHRPAALLAQAQADRVGSGLAELTDQVTSLVRERAAGLAELTRRRLAAAFDDTRLSCRDTAFTRQWSQAPLDGHTPFPEWEDGPLPTGGGAELWDRFENDTVGLLAVRAGRQGRRSPPADDPGPNPSRTSRASTPSVIADASSLPDPTSFPDVRPEGREEESP